MDYADKALKCKECGQEFVWTTGEQEFFHAKGLKNKPSRCKECRKINRQRVEAEYFKVVCSQCHQVGEVMFAQSDPKAKIFCKDCYQNLKTEKQN